jgi:Nitroreductase
MRRNLFIFTLLFCIGSLTAQNIKLPKPQTTGGKPLMQALQERATNRNIDSKELAPQVLSNLLWATNGQNRPDGRRTAPTASNCQEIDVYAFLSTGIYLYEPASHSLILKKSGDFRKESNRQGFVGGVNLAFVVDYDKMGRYDGNQEAKEFYSTADVGYVSQNTYLFCASEGLATVVQGMIDREKLSELLQITNGKVLLGQAVGYPKK